MRLAALLALLTCLPLAVSAQDPPATMRLQEATVVAKGTTISITRLPIHTASGTIYRDVTIKLEVDAQGHVTLATDEIGHEAGTGMPAPAQSAALQSVPSGQAIELDQKPSPPVVMQIFRAGVYAASDGSLVRVHDGGNDLIHGVPLWTLSSEGTGVLTEATWYSGPPSMNPRSRRLRSAGITGTEYAYGTSDAGSGGAFGSGALIGIQQVGSALRIVSFRHGCCRDTDTPTASLTLTYQGR